MISSLKRRFEHLGLAERWILILATVAAVYVAFYAPYFNTRWMGLDDYTLVACNPHLGYGRASWVWGLLDVRFGRRWTPVLWSVANLVGMPSPIKFHLLVFVLGCLLAQLMTVIYVRACGFKWGLLASLGFVCSPMRSEVFGWEMGFVYETVAIFCALAWLSRKTVTVSFVCMVCALLTYPIASGAALLWALYQRRSMLAPTLLVFLAWLYTMQMGLRRAIGFIPWRFRWDALPLVIPHYSLAAVLPLINLPIFPAVFYPLIPLGGALLVLAVMTRPANTFCWLLLLSPVLLASVTESFWFGARYALLPDMWAFYALTMAVKQDTGKLRGWLALAFLLALGGLNLSERWMWEGAGQVVAGVYSEGLLLGRDLHLLVRTIKIVP